MPTNFTLFIAISGDNAPHEPCGSRASSISSASDTGPHRDSISSSDGSDTGPHNDPTNDSDRSDTGDSPNDSAGSDTGPHDSTNDSDGSDTGPHSDSTNDSDGSDTGPHSDSDSDGSDTVVPSDSTGDSEGSETDSHGDSDSDGSDTARPRAPSGTLDLVDPAAKNLDNLLSIFRHQHQTTYTALRKIRYQAKLIVQSFNLEILGCDKIVHQLVEQMNLLQAQIRDIDVARRSLRQGLTQDLSPTWVDRIFSHTTSASGLGLNSPPLTGHQPVSTTEEDPTDNNTTTPAEIPTGNNTATPLEVPTVTDNITTTPAGVPTVTDEYTTAPAEVLTGDNIATPLEVPTVTNNITTTPTHSDTSSTDTLSDSSLPSKKRRWGL